MSAEKTELREILENNIGDVYKNALAALGDQAAAKDVTRRVMALLKRTYEAGLSVTPETVKRLTEDCCKEQTSYNSKKAAFRDGVIADMPDFDTAIASITGEEVRAKARSDAEDKAVEAHRAMGEAEALAVKVVSEPRPVSRYTPPERHFSCAADLFDDFDDEEEDVPEDKRTKETAFQAQSQDAPRVDTLKEARERVQKAWQEYDLDDDDEYDDYDDDDDDDEYEPLFEKKEKTPVLPLIGIWMLIIILAAVAFCLAVMLMQRNVLPGGSSSFVQNFAAWFNSHLFPLF